MNESQLETRSNTLFTSAEFRSSFVVDYSPLASTGFPWVFALLGNGTPSNGAIKKPLLSQYLSL
jgi:hypothetical protein